MTEIRETQNLNSWSVGLAPAVILSTSRSTSTNDHRAGHPEDIPVARATSSAAGIYKKTELVGRHGSSKSGSNDSTEAYFVSDKVPEVNGTMPASVSYYIYSLA